MVPVVLSIEEVIRDVRAVKVVSICRLFKNGVLPKLVRYRFEAKRNVELFGRSSHFRAGIVLQRQCTTQIKYAFIHRKAILYVTYVIFQSVKELYPLGMEIHTF